MRWQPVTQPQGCGVPMEPASLASSIHVLLSFILYLRFLERVLWVRYCGKTASFQQQKRQNESAVN